MKKKYGKSADHTYVFNTLTNFQYEAHQTTGNGNVEGWFATNNELKWAFETTVSFVDLGLILSSAVQQPAPHSARRAGGGL